VACSLLGNVLGNNTCVGVREAECTTWVVTQIPRRSPRSSELRWSRREVPDRGKGALVGYSVVTYTPGRDVAVMESQWRAVLKRLQL
jgi:hypothetical protein